MIAQLTVDAAPLIRRIHLSYRDRVPRFAAVDIFPAVINSRRAFATIVSHKARNLVAAATCAASI
ncbi:hypothetical protein [Rhizobium giardinii]|uniref:hypothetical protein n=1 Tax=Rhizobium giardinii TaxID=56731 RepID=UPI003D6EBE6F